MKMGKSVSAPLLTITLVSSLLVGCGGGSGGSIDVPPDPPFDESDTQMNGTAVKGPILGGTVAVYDLDDSAVDFKGPVIATGTTDAKTGAITDLVFPRDGIRLTDNFKTTVYIVEVTGGTSLTSNAAPKVAKQRMLLGGQDILDKAPIYPNPLTTLAFEIAKEDYADIVANDSTLGPDVAMSHAYSDAEDKVRTAFGFGLLQDDPATTDKDETIDLNHTSPIATDENALKYRTAIEGTAAIIDNIRNALVSKGKNFSGIKVLEMIADDLTDGVVDGQGASGAIDGLDALESDGALRPQITADPATLMIPGTSRPVSEVNEVLKQEFATVEPGKTPSDLSPLPTIPHALGGTSDSDGDGVLDQLDLFPNNPKESADTDGDCAATTKNYSSASAGDGCGDNSDAFVDDARFKDICSPDALAAGDAHTPTKSGDLVTLEYQTKKGCFDDADSDGVPDFKDVFPNNPREAYDSDGDCKTKLNYSDSRYLEADAGDDCGDAVDYNVCYVAKYARVTEIRSQQTNQLGLYGGTILERDKGGPIKGGQVYALLDASGDKVVDSNGNKYADPAYYYTTTAHMDIVDKVVHVDPFRVTLTVYTIQNAGDAPSDNDTWAAYSALDVNWNINITDPQNITGSGLNSNCADLNDIFTGAFNAGCGALAADLGGPLEPPPASNPTAWTDYHTQMTDINGVEEFVIQTSQAKAAGATDDVTLYFKGTKVSSDVTCPTN